MQMTQWKSFAFENYIPQILFYFYFFSFLLDTTTKNFQYQMLWLLIITNNPAYIVNVQLVLD